MFNVAVLRLKDITKYLVGIIFTIVIVIVATRYFSFKKKDVINNNDNNIQKSSNIISKQVQGIKTYMLKSGISQTIPVISAVTEDEKEKEEKTTNNFLENILTSEINIMRGLEENKDNNKSEEQVNDENTVTVNQNETEENKLEQQNTEIELAKTDVKTEVVTNNPIAESFNVQYGNVKIKNQTSYTLTEDMLKRGHDSFIMSLCYALDGTVVCDTNAYIRYRQHAYNTSGSSYGVVQRVRKEWNNLIKKRGSESIIARSLLENWGKEIKPEETQILRLVASIDTSVLSRIKIFFSKKFVTGNLILTVTGKIKVLFGLL